MKKFLSILTALLMITTLSACGSKTLPKDAFTNNSKSKQGRSIISMNLTTNTGSNPETVKLIMDSIFGSSEDSKKFGFESTLKATYQGKALEGKFNINADLSGKEPKISMEAGVPVETLANFGLTMPTPLVFTLSEADFAKLIKGQNLNLDSTLNAESLKKNAEILQKLLVAFNDLKIEAPKDAGSGSVTLEGKTYEGEKYTAHLTDEQLKGIIKSVVKIGMEIEKENITKSGTNNTSIPTEQELNAQIDEAFKSINLKDGVNATMIVDKAGYLSYFNTAINIKDPAGASEVGLDISVGYSDLDSSVKGLDYYNKNKTGMYKDATVMPIMQYLEGAMSGNQNDPSSLFGLGN